MTRVISSLALMAISAILFNLTLGVPMIATVSVLLAVGFVKGLLNIKTQTNMAFTGFVVSDTTYAGEAASQFIVKNVIENETVSGGHVYVKDGIKKKYTIPRFSMDYTTMIQDRAATPISQGQFTVDGRTLEPKDYMIYIEFNPRDFEDHWYATQLNPTLIDRSLPNTAESVMVREVMKRHGRFISNISWNGDTTLPSTSKLKYFNGFIKNTNLATGGTDDALVVSGPTTLSAANIQAEFQKGFDKLPAELKYDPSMKFFVSYTDYDFYMQSQINQTYKGGDITSVGIDKFRGHPVVKIADIPASKYLIAKGSASMESNLWLGMNSMDDETQIKLSPLQNNSDMWFLKVNMKLDAQIGWNSETVSYGI